MTTWRVRSCRLISEGVVLIPYRTRFPSGTRAGRAMGRCTASRSFSTWAGSCRRSNGQPYAHIHRVPILVLVGGNGLPADQRAHSADDVAGRHTRVNRPLPIYGQAKFWDVLLQRYFQVNDSRDLVSPRFRSAAYFFSRAISSPRTLTTRGFSADPPAHSIRAGRIPGIFSMRCRRSR